MTQFAQDSIANHLKRFFTEAFMSGFGAGIEIMLQMMKNQSSMSDEEADKLRVIIMEAATDSFHSSQGNLDDTIQDTASALIPFYQTWIKLMEDIE